MTESPILRQYLLPSSRISSWGRLVTSWVEEVQTFSGLSLIDRPPLPLVGALETLAQIQASNAAAV